MKAVLLLLLIIPTVAALDHPYMYLNSQNLDEIKTKYNSAEYADFKWKINHLSDSVFGQTVPTPTQFIDPDYNDQPDYVNINTREQALLSHAFLYLMTDNPIYLTRARNMINGFLNYESWLHAENIEYNDLARAHLTRGLAIAYDWLYNDLTVQERANIQERLLYEIGDYSHLESPYAEAGDYYFWTSPWPTWLVTSPWQNHGWHSLSGMAIAGYALRNERAEAQEIVDFSIAKMDEWSTLLPEDGSWHEGHGYQGYGFGVAAQTYFLAHTLDNHPYPDEDYYRNVSRFLAHTTLPGSNTTYPFAAIYDLEFPAAANTIPPLLALLTTSYNQPLAEYFYDIYTELLGSWTVFPQNMLMHQNTPPTQPSTLPKIAYYEDLGILTARNNWTESSHFVGFKSGWYGGNTANEHYVDNVYEFNNGHEHRDNNNVIFWHNKEYILTERYDLKCDHPHLEGYRVVCREAKAHNLPTFDNLDMIYERSIETPAGIAAYNAYKASTDPLTFEKRPQYLYATADSHRLYEPAIGLQKFRRSIVFYDDTLIIIDNIVISTPRTIQQHFHSYMTMQAATGGARLSSANNLYRLNINNPSQYTINIVQNQSGYQANINTRTTKTQEQFIMAVHPWSETVSFQTVLSDVHVILPDMTFIVHSDGSVETICPELDFTGDCLVDLQDLLYLSTHYTKLQDLVMVARNS